VSDDDILTCEWCDRTFARPNGMGPPPKFCSNGHRQRAYEVRRTEALVRDVTAERDRLLEALMATYVILEQPTSAPNGDYTIVPLLVANRLAELDRLRAVVDVADDFWPLIEAIYDQAKASWEFDDPRLKWVTVQIDKVDLPTLYAAYTSPTGEDT
jgi:hypothetical protein